MLNTKHLVASYPVSLVESLAPVDCGHAHFSTWLRVTMCNSDNSSLHNLLIAKTQRKHEGYNSRHYQTLLLLQVSNDLLL